MRLGRRISRWLGLRFSGDTPPRPVDRVMAEMWRGGGRVTRAEALTVAPVLRGRNILCSIAALPLEQVDDQHNVSRSPLLRQIDPDVTNIVTLAQTIEDLLFDARAWWLVTERTAPVGGAAGWPVSCQRVDPHSVTLNPPRNRGTAGAPPEAWLPANDDPRAASIWVDGWRVDPRNMIRFDSPNPGICTAGGVVIRQAIELGLTATAYAKNPRPLDYFKPTDGIDPASDEDISQVLADWLTARREGTTAYIPAALDYEQVDSPNPIDLQLIQQRQQVTLEIANLIGLDPEELGVSTTSRTYQNGVDRRKDKINDTYAPYMSAITERLSMGDVTPRTKQVRFNLDGFLQPDPKTRVEVYQGLAGLDALTDDEIRHREGLPPLTAAQRATLADRRAAAAPRDPIRVPATVGRPNAIAASAGFGFSADDGTSFEFAVSFAVDVETRTIRGIAVPYGPNAIGVKFGKRFRFVPGSVHCDDLAAIKLCRDHDLSQRLGQIFEATETPLGLEIAARVSPGPDGDRALALAADGELTGLSVYVVFSVDDLTHDPLNDGVWLIHRATLTNEISMVKVPAFNDARLTSLAASAEPTRGAPPMECSVCGQVHAPGAVACTPTTTTPVVDAPVVDTPPAAATVDAAFAAGPEFVNPAPRATPAVVTRDALPYAFNADTLAFGRGDHDFSTDIVRWHRFRDSDAQDRCQRFVEAQFTVESSNVAGLNPSTQRPDLYVDQIDYPTPLWDAIAAGIITDSTPFILPKFSSSSGMVAAHTPGSEPSSGEFAVTTQTITPVGFSGKVELWREIIDAGGNPQSSGLIWKQMLRSFYEYREAAVATFLNTLTAAADVAITAAGAALAAEWSDAVANENFTRGGNMLDTFVVAKGLYKQFSSLTAADGRKVYPMINPMNANGTAAKRYKTMDVDGVTAYPAYALSQTESSPQNSWWFNKAYVHGWFSPPRRIDLEYELKSVYIGIWGYTALANTDIGQVRQVIYDDVA